jgi:hypothetical protein
MTAGARDRVARLLALAGAVTAAACTSAATATPAPPSSGGASPLDARAEHSYRVGTMSELMVDIIYPASDAVFYIATRTPTTSEEWAVLQGQTLMLAESANLLMMPERARDLDQWMRDARLMLDAGEAAYRAAKDRDVAALEALSDQLYDSCVTCHLHYRPDYGRR